MKSNAWDRLAAGYETARQRPDSLDRILEWPTQLQALGDVTGMRILDLGCGNGSKALALAAAGADRVVGLDISGAFIEHTDPRVELITGDLSEIDAIDSVGRDRYDRVLILQSLSYSADQVRTLTDARRLLAPGGRILVQRSHPIRFAVERTESEGISLGEAYYATTPYVYPSRWNPAVSLSHSTETFSAMLNTFAAAGLHVERAIEPQLDSADRERFPHKQDWLDRYLGVILFVLAPLDAGGTALIELP